MSSPNQDIEQYFEPIKQEKTSTIRPEIQSNTYHEKPSTSSQEEDIEQYFEPKKEEGGLLGTPRQLGVHAQEAVSQVIGGFGGDLERQINEWMQAGLSKIGAEKLAKSYAKSGTTLPTSEQVREYLNNLFEGKFAPETEEEKTQAERTGFGASLMTPSILGKGFSAGRAALAPIFQMIGEKGVELSGGSPQAKKIAGAISSIIPLVVKGQVRPHEKELEELYETGKKVGLSDEELTPLLNLRTTKVIENSPLHGIINNVKTVLGSAYERLKKLPKMTSQVPSQQKEKLLSELRTIGSELRTTPRMTPQQESAVKFIDETIDNITKNGTTGEGLVNYWQGINQEFGGTAGTKLEGLKNAIASTLNSIDPAIAKDYYNTNSLYERMKSFSVIPHDKMVEFLEKGKPWAAALVGFNLGLKNLALSWAGLKTIEIINKNLLMNPKWQNIVKTTQKAIINKSPRLGQLAMRQLKDKVKEELPDEYNDVKWEEIEKSFD